MKKTEEQERQKKDRKIRNRNKELTKKDGKLGKKKEKIFLNVFLH